jgi:hypothetical protein
MGKYLCEKHGEQGLVHVCEHVWQDIVTGSSTIDCVITAQEVWEYFRNEPVGIALGYCDDCAKEYGLPFLGGVLPDPPSETPTEFGKQQKVVCSECFRVLKESLRPCESA